MIAIAWKATAVLIAAFCAARILQGRSAALRQSTTLAVRLAAAVGEMLSCWLAGSSLIRVVGKPTGRAACARTPPVSEASTTIVTRTPLVRVTLAGTSRRMLPYCRLPETRTAASQAPPETAGAHWSDSFSPFATSIGVTKWKSRSRKFSSRSLRRILSPEVSPGAASFTSVSVPLLALGFSKIRSVSFSSAGEPSAFLGWKAGFDPVVVPLSPYEEEDPAALGVATRAFALAKAGLVVMDCIGFRRKTRDTVQRELDVPVLVANLLVARVVAELCGL